ncbi:LysR family transcriptional regulator [Pseudoblastomonas halimionae]|nr:LysR family transcriptional regulator [Alteriqipengyuania halimionae]
MKREAPFEKSKALDWSNVPVFLALMRAGTLSGAARALGVVPSSVSRQIESLEHRLGSLLFERTPRGYLPTPAARDLLVRAEEAERAIGAFAEMGRDRDQAATGSVRIATAENFANSLILPMVGPFLDRYPGLRLEIVTDIRTANLSRREADIALRLVRPKTGPYVVSRVATMESGVFASDSYLAGEHTEDTLIAWDDGHLDLEASQWLKRLYPEARVAITATSLASQLAAAGAGAGLAALPTFLADGLDRVGDGAMRQPVWLVQHADNYRTAAISAVTKFLRACLAASALET